MNPLFLKKRKANLLITITCILFFYNFQTIKNIVKDPFITLCENSDAYYTYSYTDVTYEPTWGQFKRHISITNKLVVNTTKGVDNYAFLNLDKHESNNIKEIKIRTLKADGSIVELDSSLVFKRSSKNKKFEAISYPIPAVEPGDTIETSYVYSENLRKSSLMSYANFYTSLPSKNSQYTIKTKPSLFIRYKPYNGFPEPEIVTNDSLIYLKIIVE